MTVLSCRETKGCIQVEQTNMSDEEERGESVGDIKSWFSLVPNVLVPRVLSQSRAKEQQEWGTLLWFCFIDQGQISDKVKYDVLPEQSNGLVNTKKRFQAEEIESARDLRQEGAWCLQGTTSRPSVPGTE